MGEVDLFDRPEVRCRAPFEDGLRLRLLGEINPVPRMTAIDHVAPIRFRRRAYRMRDEETGEELILLGLCELWIGHEFYEGNAAYCRRVLEERLAALEITEDTRGVVATYLGLAHGGADGRQDVDQPGAARGRRGAGGRGDGQPPDPDPGG